MVKGRRTRSSHQTKIDQFTARDQRDPLLKRGTGLHEPQDPMEVHIRASFASSGAEVQAKIDTVSMEVNLLQVELRKVVERFLETEQQAQKLQAERVRPPESPSAAARVFTARPTGARVSVHSRASQLPSGARPESRSRPLLDSRASFNLDGGDLLASRDILHFSRAPAQMHSGAQVARSPPPHRRHVSPHIGPQGAQVPDRRAGVSGILHRAVAPAGEPPTSGSAERRGPGRHFEFIEPAAAGAITAQICRGWFQGGSLGSRSRWAPPGQRQ
ncbi:hypothetical protein NDU88_000487 [Pleurodeles waltl]|uniref:Uncharacterized protein n=1 Tax=Pleurodeles waltl TaxID=8319 RepID=A0AAV7TGH6_PLEWA|nr:hypothetical protein NDU88_000487 [Pleurodeles waltl]